MGRSFIRTYALALGILLVIGIGILAATRIPFLFGDDPGRPRPTPAVLAPYSINVGNDGSAPERAEIGEDGAACTALEESGYLATACVLALNVDPNFIAAEAVGKLNVVDTPSYEAMIWRAFLEQDPSVCDQGGLLDARLETCRESAVGEALERSAGPLTVEVLR